MGCKIASLLLLISSVGFGAQSNLTNSDPSKVYILFNGDSITAYSRSYAYDLQTYYGTNHFKFFTNSAVAGFALHNMTNQWPGSIGIYSPGTGTNAILSTWIGANDYTETLLTVSLSAYCAQLSNYWKMVQSSNMAVVAFTITKRSDVNGETVQSEINRTTINDYIRTSGIPDYVIDTAALLPDNHDLTLFSDGIHPTTLGHTNVMNEWLRVVTVPRAIQIGTLRAANAVFY